MLSSLAGAPYQDDAERAFAKIERALPKGCRQFLDNLPVAIKAKFAGRKKSDERRVTEIVNRATDALLRHRRVAMRYDSRASRRAKDYIVEPLRISYADGGTYLTAYVPEYGELRNFAVERIRTLGVTDEQFAPRPLPSEPFADSLGVFSGPAERVELEFDATTALHVVGREWHPSQTFEPRDRRIGADAAGCLPSTTRFGDGSWGSVPVCAWCRHRSSLTMCVTNSGRRGSITVRSQRSTCSA